MATVYVYSPFSGTIWGKDQYCNGDPHVVVWNLGGGLPIDIGNVSEGTIIRFAASSQVKSIRTKRAPVCRSQTGDWNQGVVVEMFAQYNAQCYIGTVSYGHVRNWVSDGVYNTRNKMLGVLPHDCNCGCSDGIHIHMQCGGGTRTGLNQCAGKYVSGGSTWIYKWSYYGWC